MYESFTLFFSISGGGREQCNAQRLLLLFTMQAREFSFPKINSLFKKGGGAGKCGVSNPQICYCNEQHNTSVILGLDKKSCQFCPFRAQDFVSI